MLKPRGRKDLVIGKKRRGRFPTLQLKGKTVTPLQGLKENSPSLRKNFCLFSKEVPGGADNLSGEIEENDYIWI